MHPLLVSRVVFPLIEWGKGKRTHARLREIEDTQWLAPGALRDLQLQRLRRHLEVAYRDVPYYTRLLDAHGLEPRHVQSFADFARIPHLTKDAIRQHFDDLQPRQKGRRVIRMSTGGSTGAPVTVLADTERTAFADAARLRTHRWFGVDMGAREIVLWASAIELTRQDWLRAIRDRLINSRLLSAFDLGEAALARYAATLDRYRPEKLFGYASALHRFASYLQGTGWRSQAGWPRAVFATAEPLYEFQRATIEAVFGCPVSVEYGSRDAGLMATECPAGGLHVAAEGMYVEVSDSGEIIVTNMDTFAMPIIRYRTGDVGAFEATPCPCGRGLPRLRGVEGRQTDFLVTAGGKVMHALAVIYVLREVSSIREFQVVQDDIDHLTVSVIPDNGFSASTRAVITSKLARLFDGQVTVNIVLTDTIARPPSGKHRYVISKVAPGRTDGPRGAP